MLRQNAVRRVADSFGPPLHPEETTVNLTVLQQKLSREMKCPAGRGQIYLRSLLTGGGVTKPRVALKCSFRRELKMSPEVYYEWIRDVCCKDPAQCEAFREFQERLSRL